MLLAVLPPDTDISNILGEIAKQIVELSNVEFFLACYQGRYRFKCDLSLVLGDSPASNTLVGNQKIVSLQSTNFLGIRYPTCNQPCRKCHTDALSLGKIPEKDEQISPDVVKWPFRSMEETNFYVTNARNNDKESQDALIQNGITYYLVWFTFYLMALTWI